MTTPQTLAAALLDAHVTYMTRQLTTPELFAALVDQELERSLANAAQLRLSEVVSADAVKATVHKYALDLDLGAGILELVAAMARTLYAHGIHRQVSLNHLLSDYQFAEFLDKLLELQPLREHFLRELVVNPVYVSLASDLLYQGLRGYLTQFADRESGARASLYRAGQVLWKRMPASVEESLDASLRRYVRKSMHSLLSGSEQLLASMSDQQIRDALLDLWDNLKQRPLGESQQLFSELDLEEFFVLVYEFWREFRATDYCRVLLDVAVDTFFVIYGQTTLLDLLDEVGVDRDMMRADALRFGPPVIQVLQKRGMLQDLLRRQLAGFYASPEFLAVMAAQDSGTPAS